MGSASTKLSPEEVSAMSNVKIWETAAWAALKNHKETVTDQLHLRDLLQDTARSQAMMVEHNGITLDFSRQIATTQTLDLLCDLANAAMFEQKRTAMFSGEHINNTEDRAVGHYALRAPRSAGYVIDGVNASEEVNDVLDKMFAFAEKVRSGEWTGATGKPLTTVIAIGIGGSYLGPDFLFEALKTDGRAAAAAAAAEVPGQRGPHRLRALHGRGGPGDLPGAHREQDVHHGRDHAERAHDEEVAGGRHPLGGRRHCGRQAHRGRVHRCGGGGGLWDRPGQHVRLLELGGRPVQRVLGRGRVPAGAALRPRGDARVPARHARDGRALPDGAPAGEPPRAAGPLERVELDLPGLPQPGAAALLPGAHAAARPHPAGDHGVERQARDGERGRGAL
ncbi:unnamed protein product [Heterosigma akashiwo]